MDVSMSSDRSDYQPISCDFHDIPQAVATTGRPATVLFVDDGGFLQRRSARILDVYSRGGAEFITISTGEILRLDRLVAVDEARRIDY